MADLKETPGKYGFQNVRTYIQSGNVVFGSAELIPSTKERGNDPGREITQFYAAKEQFQEA